MRGPIEMTLDAIAGMIDTGLGDESVARALVVFNLTDGDLTGFACMPAEIGWPAGAALPRIIVSVAGDDAGTVAEIRLPEVRPDPRGRPGRVRISFELCFVAADIPACGWKTYSAAYADSTPINGMAVRPSAKRPSRTKTGDAGEDSSPEGVCASDRSPLGEGRRSARRDSERPHPNPLLGREREPDSLLELDDSTPIEGLVVIETGFHSGSLPACARASNVGCALPQP